MSGSRRGFSKCSMFGSPYFVDVESLIQRPQRLSFLMVTGWPTDKRKLDPLVRPYLTFKDELSLADGIAYKGQQAVIPKSMRPAMLDKIHNTHFGAGSCIRRAKVSLFWPGMTSDIKNKSISCPVCVQYASQVPKEPMLSHDIPEQPWSLISQDILMWEGKWHLVTTCQYSDWIEIDILPNTLTSTVVELTKAHFARFGVPDRVVTDNGPQFISTEYKQFVSEYGFEHVTSSPYWPQGNGKAEAAVKTAKRMYQKNKDIHMALLDYRNTPQQGQEQSPAQRLLSRRTSGILPMMPSLLQPTVVYSGTVKTEIQGRRARAKHYYDRNLGGVHGAIQPGQWVYAKLNPQHKHSAWPHGIVEKVSSPKSYTVVTPHGKIRRNRVQIRLAAAPPADAKTYMSRYTGSQTRHSDSSDDIASPAQPLRLTKGPKPFLNQGLRSLQGEPPNPGNQPSPAKNPSPSPAISSPQIHPESTASAVNKPNQMLQSSSRVRESSQSTDKSISSDAQCNPAPLKEVRTRSGRFVRPPARLNL